MAAIREVKAFLAHKKLDDHVHQLLDNGYDDLDAISQLTHSELQELESLFKKDDDKQVKPTNKEYLNSSFQNLTLDVEKNAIEIKQIKTIINNELNEKQIVQISKEMSPEYIIDLYKTYEKMKRFASKISECENIIFVNRFKQFLLDSGVSEKKLYEQCIRLIIYNKNNFTFIDFHQCFQKILNLKYEYNFIKYKLLLHLISRKNEKTIEIDELERFMKLLKSGKMFDIDIYNKINYKLKDKYKEMFPKLDYIHFKKLSFVLELFFNLR